MQSYLRGTAGEYASAAIQHQGSLLWVAKKATGRKSSGVTITNNPKFEGRFYPRYEADRFQQAMPASKSFGKRKASVLTSPYLFTSTGKPRNVNLIKAWKTGKPAAAKYGRMHQYIQRGMAARRITKAVRKYAFSKRRRGPFQTIKGGRIKRTNVIPRFRTSPLDTTNYVRKTLRWHQSVPMIPADNDNVIDYELRPLSLRGVFNDLAGEDMPLGWTELINTPVGGSVGTGPSLYRIRGYKVSLQIRVTSTNAALMGYIYMYNHNGYQSAATPTNAGAPTMGELGSTRALLGVYDAHNLQRVKVTGLEQVGNNNKWLTTSTTAWKAIGKSYATWRSAQDLWAEHSNTAANIQHPAHRLIEDYALAAGSKVHGSSYDAGHVAALRSFQHRVHWGMTPISTDATVSPGTSSITQVSELVPIPPQCIVKVVVDVDVEFRYTTDQFNLDTRITTAPTGATPSVIRSAEVMQMEIEDAAA